MQRHDDAAPVAEDYSKSSRFVRFDLPLFDAILRAPFTRSQLLVVLVIVRRTYGFETRRTGRKTSVRKIEKRTGLSRSATRIALAKLKAAGVVIERSPAIGSRSAVLAIQPDPSRWGFLAPVEDSQASPLQAQDPVDSDLETVRDSQASPLDCREGSYTDPGGARTQAPGGVRAQAPFGVRTQAPIKEEESKNIEDSSSLEDAAAWGAAATSQEENEEPAAESVLTREEGKAKVSDYLAKKREEKRRAAMDHGLGVVSDGTA